MNYERRIVFFVDILGFRSMVETAKCDDIFNILKFIQDFYDEEVGIKPKSKEITLFSDSVVISINIKDLLDKGELFLTFSDFQNLIIRLIMKGIFVRGAITFGDLYHDADILFGPAFIEAYLYEKENAVYPRVVCLPDIFDASNDVGKLIKDNAEFHDGLLVKDDDGIFYIDYFAGATATLDNEDQEAIYIKKLKEETGKNLGAAIVKGDKKVTEKYIWVKKKIDAVFV